MMAIDRIFRFVWCHPLTKGERLVAIQRVVRWQVATRLLSTPIVLPFVEGTSLVVERGMTGATGNWYCGLHEHAEMLFVLRVLRPEDLFADVGANVGSYTILSSGVVGAKTVSFEPIPATYRHLRRNVEYNGLSNLVTLYCKGVSSRAGTLRFSTDLDTSNHVVSEDEAIPCTSAQVVTLDNALRGLRASVLKIDVEGHEIEALKGATRVLEDPSLLAVLMETNRSGARYGVLREAPFELLDQLGFKAYVYDPENNLLRPSLESETNTIFIRNLAAVEDRLRGPRRFRLVNRIV